MPDSDVRTLVYSPECSWHTIRTRVQFNHEVICAGHPLKVRVSNASSLAQIDGIALRILDGDTEQKQLSLLSLRPSAHIEGSWYLTVDSLVPGLYVARVELQGEVLAEHFFDVLSVEQYQSYWRTLFGTHWDEPVYWDWSDEQNIFELLGGWPSAPLIKAYPKHLHLDGPGLYSLLGPILTMFMSLESGPVPYRIEYRNTDQQTCPVPHEDLTKLMWYLSVLGPLLNDRAFFAAGLTLEHSFTSTGLEFHFSFQADWPKDTGREWWDSSLRLQLPVLFDLANELVGSLTGYLDQDDPHLFLHIKFSQNDNKTAAPRAFKRKPGFEWLFDGTRSSFELWRMVGEGSFSFVDELIVTNPGADLGFLYYPLHRFGDFILSLEVRLDEMNADSGIFVRSLNPSYPVPDRFKPEVAYSYHNQAYVPVNTGFEVQIDELARGNPQHRIPDGLNMNRTGAIYGVEVGEEPGKQRYLPGAGLRLGEWTEFEIWVKDDKYIVNLDGQEMSSFINDDVLRGRSPSEFRESGYIGLQCNKGQVAFRNIQLKRL